MYTLQIYFHTVDYMYIFVRVRVNEQSNQIDRGFNR